ncbi:MAG TPA: hypothetical protein VGP45_09395 [Marinobacter sp.]|nr:hypothetical protein [Marinobacter sp.]
MFLRVCLLAATCVLLGACATGPRFSSVCISQAPETALLHIERPGEPIQRLLLHAETGQQQQVWVALDTLGSPQFTARQNGDQLTAETSGLYRGMEPLPLLWGYQWWLLSQSADSAQRCASITGYEFSQDQQQMQILSGRQVRWQWQHDSPQVFELPQQNVRIRVQVL